MADSNEREANLEAGVRMVKTVDGIEYAFHWCPAGTFLMGSPENEGAPCSNETQHEVTLTQGFWMLETPVTVGMFRSFAKDTGYESQGDMPCGWNAEEEKWKRDFGFSWENPGFSQDDTHPVVCVSWDDAAAFCRWLGEKTGLNVTLPTEAQWEYACRAGTTTPFSFGETLNGDKANCDGNCPYGTDEKGPRIWKTTPVRTYAPNAWGLYDMHGNVWEWCESRYYDYPDKAEVDPTGPEGDSFHVTRSFYVTRGGSWFNMAVSCRSAFRVSSSQSYRYSDSGFRPVASGR